MTTRTRTRVLTALTSLTLAAIAGWLILDHFRKERETVELVDNSREVAEQLAKRMSERAPIPIEGGLPALGRDFGRRLLEDVDEDTARAYSPATRKNSYEYVPGVLFRLRPNLDAWRPFAEHPEGGFQRATNSLGMREDSDPGASPDTRILVVGDSHVSGVCANGESLPNRLESRLATANPGRSVEVWNVAQGGYEPPNYLGVLETYADLEPDALVAVVYGGNDFRGVLGLWRYVYRERGGANRVPWDLTPLREVRGGPGLLGQELNQATYFAANEELSERATDVVAAIAIELERQCAERGASFLAVYLPPPSSGQPHLFGQRLRDALASIGAPPEETLATSDRMADRMLAALEQHGVRALDLRPAFRAHERPLYWDTDLHLAIDGHELAAQEVERVLDLTTTVPAPAGDR